MSGLFTTLSSSVKALNAHSRAIEVAGRNLANVNNSSYARQRVVYSDGATVQTADGTQSLGLEVVGVQQLRDSLLDRQVTREIALKSGYETEQQAYQRAQAALGQSIDLSATTGTTTDSSTGGIAASLDDFFNAFQSFATRPTDTGERQLLLQKAAILTDRLQLTDDRLAQVQTDLDAQVTSDVSEVNDLLQSIADLNAEIGSLEISSPGSAVDLRDQRQARLEELAAKMPVEVSEDSSGQIEVYARDASDNPVTLVSLGTVVAPVAYDGSSISAGSPPITLNLESGSINGAITASTGTVQTLRTSLNALVEQLVTSVNDAYNPTGTTGDFFDASGLSAGTISLDSTLNATNLKASDGGAAGDNTIALAVAALSQQIFDTSSGDSIDGTFSEHYTRCVTELGQSLASANAKVTDQTNIEELVRSQRDSVSGVSLDEEMADLVRFQRAYQASSRVFSVVNDLLDNVVNQLGR